MIHRFLQRFDAAIVHVRRGDRDVAQGGRLELADVLLLVAEFVKAQVRRRVGKLPRQIVEAGIVKLDFGEALVQVIDRTGQVEAAVAVKTLQALAEEQRFAALCRFGNGVAIVAVLVSVIR